MSMTSAAVSVLVAVYNGAAFVAESIKSVCSRRCRRAR